MDEQAKKTVMVVGVGAVAVLALILMSRGGQAVAAGPQTSQASVPSNGTIEAPPLYSVGGFNMPSVGYPAFNLGGTGALFTFNDDGTPTGADTSGPKGALTSSDGGTSGGCGCGCAGAANSNCANSGSGTDAYGTATALAGALAPLMGYLTDQLPEGIVAPGAFAPGATPIQAQVSAWRANRDRISDSFNQLRSSTNNVMLASI